MAALSSLPSSPRVPHIDLPFLTSSPPGLLFFSPQLQLDYPETCRPHQPRMQAAWGSLSLACVLPSLVPPSLPQLCMGLSAQPPAPPWPHLQLITKILPHPVILAPNSSRLSLRSSRPRLTVKQVGLEAGKLTSDLHSASSPPHGIPKSQATSVADHLMWPLLMMAAPQFRRNINYRCTDILVAMLVRESGRQSSISFLYSALNSPVFLP